VTRINAESHCQNLESDQTHYHQEKDQRVHRVTPLPSSRVRYPHHDRLLRAPSASAKNGSLRTPMNSRHSPAWTEWAAASKPTRVASMSTSPAGSGCPA